MQIRQRRITALNAVSATTSSKKFWVGGAQRVGILLRAASITSGNGAFTVKASLEPFELGQAATFDEFNNPHGGATITMTALNVCIDNVTNTNAQNLTRVAGKTLSSNTDAMLWLDPQTLVNWLEIDVTRTTDGTYSAYIIVEDQNPSIGGF